MNAMSYLTAGIIFLFWLVAGALAGIVACAMMDGEGGFLSYTILFVFGIFTGVFAYETAGPRVSRAGEHWARLPDASRTGRAILVTSIGLMAALALLFERLFWTPNVGRSFLVPDSALPTLTFFASVAIGLGVLHHASMPSPEKADQASGN